MCMRPVEETTGFPKHPAPFRKFDFTFLQGLVAIVQGCDSLLKALAAFGEFVDLRCHRSTQRVGEFSGRPHRDTRLFHLTMEITYHATNNVQYHRNNIPAELISTYAIVSRRYPADESPL